MVFESTDALAVVRGRRAGGPAAAVVVRLPEARGRVLRQRRLGPVRAAVHDRAAVQLRRHRRGPRARRRRGRWRQREAGDEPRRARPRAEGRSRARTRCTSSATATRSGTTPTAATWPRHRRPRWSTPTRCNDDFNLSTAAVDDRARAGRADLAQDQGPGRAVPLRQRPAVRARRAEARARRREGQARCSASRRPRRSTTCSTRSSRGSPRRWPTGASERNAAGVPRAFGPTSSVALTCGPGPG